nr:response regulator [Candidatus Protochlamydia sp. W-9]
MSIPGMKRLEFLKLLKKNYSSITIFMMTAYEGQTNSQITLKLGTVEVVSKLIDFAHLRKLIVKFMLAMHSSPFKDESNG